MTNSGIVGLDAYEVGWLRRLPHAHNIPGYHIVLVGVNVETPNPLSEEPGARVRTGAFVPFGAPSGTEWAGQILVARFGDEAPMTAPVRPRVGRTVVRIDPREWSLYPVLSEGLHRPIDVRFSPSGTLHILDFGFFEIDAKRGLIARRQTGKLWRFRIRTKEE